MATPTGFERDASVGKHRENSESPSESLLPTHTKKRCTKADGSKIAKLVILAANAVRNVDLHRALELIEEIRAVGEGSGAAVLPNSIRELR